MALLSTLTDTFDAATLDTAKWSANGNGAPTPTVSGGTLNLTVNTIASSSATVKSANLYTVKDTAFYAKVVVPAGSVSNGIRTSLGLYYDVLNRCLGEMRVQDGTLYGAYYSGGAQSASLAAYNATTMAYWRVTLGATSVTFATSPDGATWTDRGTYAASLYDGDVGSVRMTLDTLTVSGVGGTAQIDNFNTVPPAWAGTVNPDGVVADPETVGAPGVSALTAYDPTQSYAAGAIVSYNGVNYTARQAVPAGRIPGMSTATKYNTAEGGTVGATATTANSGGASGDAWDSITVPASGSVTYQSIGGRKGYAIYGGGTGAGSFGNLRWLVPGGNYKLYARYRFRTTETSVDYYGVVNYTSPASFIFSANAGKFAIRRGDTIAVLATGTYTLAANTWYTIEIGTEAGTGCTVRIRDESGALLDTIVYTGTHVPSTATVANVSFGYARYSATQYIDDAQYSLTTWVGELPDQYWENPLAASKPTSITDGEVVGNPTGGFAQFASPNGAADGENVGSPAATVASIPPYGVGNYGQGLYGIGVDNTVTQTPTTPDPTVVSNYGYGAGPYGAGLYYGNVGAPSDTNPSDNPTYGSGTYGYGIYHGVASAVKDALPLFNSYAGADRPPLHILGIGPWSPVIHWRGAANYGVGAGNLPARPALPMPPASSKGFTLRLNDGAEARVELNLARGSGLVIDEMDTDLWWRRKDPRTGAVEMIGRFNTAHVDMQTSDTGLNASLQFVDYRTVLANRRVMRYRSPAHAESMWPFAAADGGPATVAEILKWAIPANTRLDLSELDTYDLGTITAPYELPPGTTLGEVFESLEAISRIDWEWWIETPNDINAAPKLRFQLGTRGLDKGVVLHDLGKGPSPILSWTRSAAADNYANSILYNGGTDKNGIGGSVVKTIPAQIVQYGQRDTVDGNSSLAGNKTLIDARAARKLAKLASRDATYTIRLANGFWRGRNHIDVGDTVRVVIRLGKEVIDEKHRVTEIDVAIDDNNLEEVTLTLGTPLPSPDPRSHRAPLQRIVRYLREFDPKAKDVVTEDD